MRKKDVLEKNGIRVRKAVTIVRGEKSNYKGCFHIEVTGDREGNVNCSSLR